MDKKFLWGSAIAAHSNVKAHGKKAVRERLTGTLSATVKKTMLILLPAMWQMTIITDTKRTLEC